MTVSLCPRCHEIGFNGESCRDCGYAPIADRLAIDLQAGRLRPTLEIDLSGSEGNIYQVYAIVVQAMRQLGIRDPEVIDTLIGNLSSRSYVENLRHMDTMFRIKPTGRWGNLEDWLLWYEQGV